MRHAPGFFLVTGLALLAGCQSRTAQLAALPTSPEASPAIPALPPGPERDAVWMKLAPQAPRDPALARTTVDFANREPVGTVIVDAGERKLYLVQPGGKALRYPVSVGKAGMA